MVVAKVEDPEGRPESELLEMDVWLFLCPWLEEEEKDASSADGVTDTDGTGEC